MPHQATFGRCSDVQSLTILCRWRSANGYGAQFQYAASSPMTAQTVLAMITKSEDRRTVFDIKRIQGPRPQRLDRYPGARRRGEFHRGRTPVMPTMSAAELADKLSEIDEGYSCERSAGCWQR